MKYCGCCGKNKVIELFYKNRSTKDGYAIACIECSKKHVKKYRLNYPEKEAKRKKNSLLTYKNNRKKYKEMVFNHYGNKCECCKITDNRFFTIDHKNNDGKVDRGLNRGYFYKKIINSGYPNLYRILCWNCNCARSIYGECPHKLVT